MRATEKRFRKLMEGKGIHFSLISSPENFYYISGYASHQHTVSRSPNMASILMKMDREKPFTKIMVMDYEYPNIRKQIDENSNCEIIPYGTWVGVKTIDEVMENVTLEKPQRKMMFDIIRESLEPALDKLQEGETLVIGIEKDFVSLNFFEQIKNIFPQCEFRDISPLLLRSRSIKTPEEIKIFRELIKVQDSALTTVMSRVGVGMKESDLAEMYKQEVMKHQNILPSSWSMFSSGENCSILGLPSERVLEDGDIFKYDGGVTKEFGFYTTDFARSWIVGKPTQELVELKNVLYTAQRLMITNMKPGVKIKDIFDIGFQYVKNRYPQYERGHLGHSISMGPSTWEAPLITKDEERILEEGMILCVEVPLYIKDLGGFNIEDMILITKLGSEILSETPHFGDSDILF